MAVLQTKGSERVWLPTLKEGMGQNTPDAHTELQSRPACLSASVPATPPPTHMCSGCVTFWFQPATFLIHMLRLV